MDTFYMYDALGSSSWWSRGSQEITSAAMYPCVGFHASCRLPKGMLASNLLPTGKLTGARGWAGLLRCIVAIPQYHLYVPLLSYLGLVGVAAVLRIWFKSREISGLEVPPPNAQRSPETTHATRFVVMGNASRLLSPALC